MYYERAKSKYTKFKKQKLCNIFKDSKTFGVLFRNKFCKDKKKSRKFTTELLFLNLSKSFNISHIIS